MGVTWTQLKSFLKVLVSWIPMATPPNTVRYKMNGGNRFFICRNCRNHLVTWNNCRGRVKKREARGFLCHDAVNVRTDPISTHRFLFNLPVVKVRCNRCNMRLGQQFFTLDSLRPLPNLMERSFLLQFDGSGSLTPENRFFTACCRLKSENKLHGIFVWSADDSKEKWFPL
ncbi:hypothetical protein GOBAR_DD07384 [Gossypium barbadense]|nr:hypothetical protein GOBAR_DD07384 [Gossypium barbadense]